MTESKHSRRGEQTQFVLRQERSLHTIGLMIHNLACNHRSHCPDVAKAGEQGKGGREGQRGRGSLAAGRSKQGLEKKA